MNPIRKPTKAPILIVGAGPTGLVLALSLAHRGVIPRIIDQKDGPARESRAIGVQARTLEFYHQFGFADEIVNEGVICKQVHMRRVRPGSPPKTLVNLTIEDMGKGLSPYPFLLAYPQDDHERFLIDKLEEVGVTVEWNTRFVSLTQDGENVQAVLERDGESEELTVDYLAGCDGAGSTVRHELNIDFTGLTQKQVFYVADVDLDSDSLGEWSHLYLNLSDTSPTVIFPVRSSGSQRLIGLVPRELHEREDLSFEDFQNDLEHLLDVRFRQVNWFSTFHVHHRVAETFQRGRAFLAGDAGHVHSPAGGQGMNTGIGDAINLGWKLADVVRGRASRSILDSYDPERTPFARRLVATTDRAFKRLMTQGITGKAIRYWVMPNVARLLTSFRKGRDLAFLTISQTAISYPDSPLSDGEEGGKRLPWVPMESGSNFDLLRSLDWQVHVYGQQTKELAEACEALHLALFALPWSDSARAAGIRRDAVYFIRPDGYVAFASDDKAAEQLQAYVKRHSLVD
ncbi:MAG: FAD-dependent monooxygenase [Pseudohongiellaceae bacterium]